MPVFEFLCEKCQNEFEELVLRRSDEAEVACPACKSRDVTRLISRPAATPGPGDGEAAAGVRKGENRAE